MTDESHLVHQYLDGTISEESRQRLNDWINADTTNAAAFAEISLLHDQLRNEYVSRRIISTSDDEEELMGDMSRSVSASTPAVRLASATIAAGIALTIVVGVLIDARHRNDVVNRPMATIASVTGNLFVTGRDGSRQVSEGGIAVVDGEILETSGMTSLVNLAFSDGTQLRIGGDSIVSVDRVAPKTLRLDRGAVSARVTPQDDAYPMVLRTPLARVDVVGTEFSLATNDDITDVQVTRGQVRVTREQDGSSLLVPEGKRAVTRAESLQMEESGSASGVWEEDYEDGLPVSTDGQFVSSGLPVGSKGGVADIRVSEEQQVYAIDNFDWFNGFFQVYEDSHLHFIYRMEHPQWTNIFMLTRGDDPAHGNAQLHQHVWNRTEKANAGVWHEAVLPLAEFHRKIDGKFTETPPVTGEICVGIAWSWVDGERGMTVDRVWITRGGPGKVVVRPMFDASDQ